MIYPLSIKVEPSGLIILAFSGDLLETELDAFKNALEVAALTISHQFSVQGKKVEIMLDMTGFSGKYSVKAMELLADFAKKNTDFVERTASFGGSPLVQATGTVVSNLAARENIKIFDTKDEALAWLNVKE